MHNTGVILLTLATISPFHSNVSFIILQYACTMLFRFRMSEPPVRVLRQLGKAVLAVGASAIAIPYTLAILANTLYGWPTGPDR